MGYSGWDTSLGLNNLGWVSQVMASDIEILKTPDEPELETKSRLRRQSRCSKNSPHLVKRQA